MDRPLVQIAPHGPTSAATRLWRFRGQLRVTVIVKATFALVHQALMKIAPPEPIVTADVHHGNNPVRSVRLTDDLAPYLPGADVLVTGHAHAPPGTKAPWVTAGIGVYDKYDCIFEKYLDVRGDPGPDGIQPFQKMPLMYERAFGGPGWQDNPFGVGAGGTKAQPNIFYIGDRTRSAGFGPWSAHWPHRKKLISNETRKALARPIADIEEGFDWSYFHAAPPDQRCAFLTGSEWVVLQGLRPNERRVRSRLPAVKGQARVGWAGDAPSQAETVELTLDTLRIDADRGTCSVTWRKSFAVEEEAHLADLAIVAAVEIGGQPIRWPAPPARIEAPVYNHGSSPSESSAISLADEDLMTVSGPRPDPRPQPMILGAFRLAVFSPKYEEDPDDPLLSTLVIRDKRPADGEAGGAGPLLSAAAPDSRPGDPRSVPSAAAPDSRPGGPRSVPSAAAPDSRPGDPRSVPSAAAPDSRPGDPRSVPAAAEPEDSMVTTLVFRDRQAPAEPDDSTVTTLVFRDRQAQAGKSGPAGTQVLHDTKDAPEPPAAQAPSELPRIGARTIPMVQLMASNPGASGPAPSPAAPHRAAPSPAAPPPVAPSPAAPPRVAPSPAAPPRVAPSPAAPPPVTAHARPVLAAGSPLASTAYFTDIDPPESTTQGGRGAGRLRNTGARRSAANLATQRFPKPAGARIDLADLAALAAALTEAGPQRADVLRAHDMSEVEWTQDARRWSEAFHRAARRGDTALGEAFDAAYVAAWETIRGPISVPDYACLSIAAERGDLAAMMATLRVGRAPWRRVRRVWARRLLTDSALARAVEEAKAALR